MSSPGLTGRSSNRENCRMHGGRTYYVYILANKIGGALYIGVTNDLVRRIYEHKSDVVDGFTRQYGIHDLVTLSNSTMSKMQFAEKNGSKSGIANGKFG
jgi:predicted GIY-YIG superfamily endonuclease